MAGNKVFSVVIFFIAFREALEAALVIGTLMGMLESLARDILPDRNSSTPQITNDNDRSDLESDEVRAKERQTLIKSLRKTVLLGAATGLSIAFVIGAAFLAVFYTQANDLYGKAEEAWEGAFNLIALLLITPMALAILRADRSRRKWRIKLKNAFVGKVGPQDEGHSAKQSSKEDAALKADIASPDSERSDPVPHLGRDATTQTAKKSLTFSQRVMASIKSPFEKANRGKTAVFAIPAITTLREGLEGVVFIGGVSLGLPATSIPLPAIVGIACGLAIGAFVFKAGSFSKVRMFLLFSTCILLLIAAGMASRSVYYLEFYQYVKKVGDAAAESGSGPGSYNALNYIWHIDCCNPEDSSGGNGYGILNSLVGWNNTGTAGSIAAYIVYWVVIMLYLLYAFWKENRLALFFKKNGSKVFIWESARAKRAREARETRIARRSL
ncbi:unnamed protein product [Sympodiomycopsis kandeliae]